MTVKLDKYAKLEGIKAFNDAIMLFDAKENQGNHARELLEAYNNKYIRENKFVLGSDKSNDIVEKNDQAEKNIAFLEEMRFEKHKGNHAVDCSDFNRNNNHYSYSDGYADMHQYTISEDYTYIGDYGETITEGKHDVTYVFFATYHHVVDVKRFLIPYTEYNHAGEVDDEYYSSNDYIANYIDQADYTSSRLIMYQLCEKIGVKFDELSKIITHSNLIWKTEFLSDTAYLYCEGMSEETPFLTLRTAFNSARIKEYNLKPLEELFEKREALIGKKYVQDDEIKDIDDLCYMTFMYRIDTGEISMYEE